MNMGKVRTICGVLIIAQVCACANILMITLAGTKSHKIPFLELAKGLIARGHNITFMNAFPPDYAIDGLEEITPATLVFYVRNFTNWDLLGARMRGEEPVSLYDTFRYGYEVCDSFLSDAETKDFLCTNRAFDLAVLDGAYPECALGVARTLGVPYIYINTVGFYTGSLSTAGSPMPFSFTPFFGRAFTDNMSLSQRLLNTGYQVGLKLMHYAMVNWYLEDVVRKHLGEDMPRLYDLSKNVSFILQNGHVTVTYPRPYMPNVAEIACIHCKPAKPLPRDLEDFINAGGDAGFIFISMGSSVKASNMPEFLRRMLLAVFEQLPYQVLWKWETHMNDLPPNVRLSRWLPQQDLLGHHKIRAFITHGGLLSMFETVYHGVPVVTLPVFCDHDSNAAKAELDGYALKLELQTLTGEELLAAIRKVIHERKYWEGVKHRQFLLRDQKETPLERAVYWTEYVARHKGAHHLLTPARNLNYIQFYLVDVAAIYLIALWALYYVTSAGLRLGWSAMHRSIGSGHARVKVGKID